MPKSLPRFALLWIVTGALLAHLDAPFCSRAALAQEVAASAKPQPGVSISAQDKTDADRIAAYVESTRAKWKVPGLSVGVVRNGKVILSKGFGVLEAGKPTPVDGDSLFAIASNSKAFTAAALAILVDEGKLDWDDKVRNYLPWLRLKDPLATDDLRVRDLLCHRSGLGTFSGDLLWYGTPYSAREVLVRAAELEPAGPFRASYGYSNLMFLAAGEVIAEVSGQSWGQFIHDRILTPAGMSRTVTSTSDLPEANTATPHKTVLDGTGQLGSRPIEWVNWDTMAAAGGLISSSNDMTRWLQIQLGEGRLDSGKSLFSRDQSHQMWHPQTIIPRSRSNEKHPETNFSAYGLGWSLKDYRGTKLASHGGGYDGMYSHVLLAPEHDTGVVVLTNSMTSITSLLTYSILDDLLGFGSAEQRSRKSAERLSGFIKSRQNFDAKIQAATQANESGHSAARSLNEYVGEFQCTMYGDASVKLEDGKLVLRLHPNPLLVADLEHMHFDTFKVTWRNESAWFGGGNVHFSDDHHGEFQSIELDIPNDDLWFYELDFQRTKN